MRARERNRKAITVQYKWFPMFAWKKKNKTKQRKHSRNLETQQKKHKKKCITQYNTLDANLSNISYLIVLVGN